MLVHKKTCVLTVKYIYIYIAVRAQHIFYCALTCTLYSTWIIMYMLVHKKTCVLTVKYIHIYIYIHCIK